MEGSRHEPQVQGEHSCQWKVQQNIHRSRKMGIDPLGVAPVLIHRELK